MSNKIYFFLIIALAASCGNKNTEKGNSGVNTTDAVLAEQKIFQLINQTDFSNLEVPSTGNIADFSAEEKADKGFVIKGEFTGTGKVVHLSEITAQSLVFIDSARVDADGKFTLSGNVSEKTLCFITINGDQPPGFPLVLDNNSKLKLSIKHSGWITYEVDGDKENKLVNELYLIYVNHDKRMQILRMQFYQFLLSFP